MLATPDAYIFGWLVVTRGCSAVAGIMVADYFLISENRTRRELALSQRRRLPLHKGFNPRAIAALVLGVTIALVGLLYEPLHFL